MSRRPEGSQQTGALVGDGHSSVAIQASGVHLRLCVREMGRSKPRDSPSAAGVRIPKGTTHSIRPRGQQPAPPLAPLFSIPVPVTFPSSSERHCHAWGSPRCQRVKECSVDSPTQPLNNPMGWLARHFLFLY